MLLLVWRGLIEPTVKNSTALRGSVFAAVSIYFGGMSLGFLPIGLALAGDSVDIARGPGGRGATEERSRKRKAGRKICSRLDCIGS